MEEQLVEKERTCSLDLRRCAEADLGKGRLNLELLELRLFDVDMAPAEFGSEPEGPPIVIGRRLDLGYARMAK
ncbi:MAG: hypothetical protein QNK03_07130 [Myxococcota bacterium]|nr:hypothetical protein [Myxococcota bacterium]